jgi:hypothetical protein
MPVLFGSTRKVALLKGASTARVIQQNINLESESTLSRLTIQETQNSLLETQQQINHAKAELLSTITQQNAVSDRLGRESLQQLIEIQQNVLVLQESVTPIWVFLLANKKYYGSTTRTNHALC